MIHWGYLSHPGVISLAFRILWFWKTLVLYHLEKMYPLHTIPPGVVQTQRIQIFHDIIWCVVSLEDSVISYKGSYVLSVFLIDTRLHVIVNSEPKINQRKAVFVVSGTCSVCVWIMICCLRLPLWVNFFPHSLHSYGYIMCDVFVFHILHRKQLKLHIFNHFSNNSNGIWIKVRAEW